MTPKIIVSYDGSANDHDALALGRLFAAAGAHISLAYVRHHAESTPAREALEQERAERLLEEGAREGDLPGAPRHVVLDRSTVQGLRRLAAAEQAQLIVFGSDYHLPEGSVRPGRTAEGLLEGGSAAIALAVARQRSRPSTIARIGVLSEGDDSAAAETAHSLAKAVGAEVVREGKVDLLVIGSRPEAPHGRVNLSAVAAYAIDTATSPVLVVPRATAISFPVRVTA